MPPSSRPPAASSAVPYPPVEPPATGWDFGGVHPLLGHEVVALGADLAPGTLLRAYRAGLFPMGVGDAGAGPIGWWSPDPRGILEPGALIVARSLRKVLPRFEVRVDTAFAQVVRCCADPARRGRWITPDIAAAYTRLHELGWAHSVETWQEGRLVGGLYGLAIGGLFAGESMFHRVRDASKVALVALASIVFADGHRARVIDAQWQTPHLASLGVVEIPREAYLGLLAQAQRLPVPPLLLAGSSG